MSARSKGWYWVKATNEEWEIAEWDGEGWYRSGLERWRSDSFWAEIGERIPDHG